MTLKSRRTNQHGKLKLCMVCKAECGPRYACVIDAITNEDIVICKDCIQRWLKDTNYNMGGIYGSTNSP